MVFPIKSDCCASVIAAWSAAPEEIPAKTPSSVASNFAAEIASSSDTGIILS